MALFATAHHDGQDCAYPAELRAICAGNMICVPREIAAAFEDSSPMRNG
jgi:hypothetical protein